MESSLPGWILVVGFSEASGVEWGGGVILGMETSSAERDSSVICHNPRGSGAPLRPRL